MKRIDCSPEIIKDDRSPTGYFVTFRYQGSDGQKKTADKIGLIGDWMFSDIHHSSHFESARLWPHQWRPDVFPHTLLGLKKMPEALLEGTPQKEIRPETFDFDWEVLMLGYYEMDRIDGGLFTKTIPLPSGTFNYRFVLDIPEGNPLKMVTVCDPDNLPLTVGGKPQPYSQVHVPFDEVRQSLDRSVELPWQGDGAGHVEIISYPTDKAFSCGGSCAAAVYLPQGYDPAGTKTYPVLYLSHGGGGNAGDWLNQGALKNMMDHFIGRGQAGPMAVVMMDNEEFRWDNAGKCIPNLKNYLIPYIEKRYNLGRCKEMRAFAGFSAGGFLAYEVLVTIPEMFDYIGVWSGGKRIPVCPEPAANPHIQVHVGAGRYDDAFYSFGYKLEDLLHETGIPFTSFFPEGAHQWSVWRRLLEDFVCRVLWK